MKDRTPSELSSPLYITKGGAYAVYNDPDTLLPFFVINTCQGVLMCRSANFEASRAYADSREWVDQVDRDEELRTLRGVGKE